MPPDAERPRLAVGLALRLGALFSLETACLAAYLPLLSLHMQRGVLLEPYEISLVYATGPVCALIAPPLMGFVADRMMAAQRALSLLNLLRALSFVLAARAADFPSVLGSMALVGFCSSPSMVLSSSISFHHLPDARRFGHVRVWGAASWIATVWLVSSYLARFQEQEQLARLAIGFELAALLSVLLAAYALTLPHTPPARLGRGALESLRGLLVLRDRNFATLFVVATVSGALFQMHLILQPLFFTSGTGLRLDAATAHRASTVSQLLELVLFPLLFVALRRLGLRRVLLLGTIAWPLRFFFNYLGQPAGMVIGGQLLHGANVVFGLMAMQIAVDEIAPRDLRASTQALLTTGTHGLGALSGQILCGVLLAAHGAGGGHDWAGIFALPLLLSIGACAVLAVGFRPQAPALAA